jgi:surfeit locus 1 family protein
VLVNRGFIPAEDRDRVAQAALQPRGANATASDSGPAGAQTAASTTVTGLLRMTEPRGGFLRHNDAAANHWYSRDVQAIAAARGLAHMAPYFVDAEAAAASAGAAPAVSGAACPAESTMAKTHAACAVVPIGGLTVVTFHNSHLVYAITWYTLALMVAGAIGLGIRSETRK